MKSRDPFVSKPAFTLIELLVVIAILAALLIPSVKGALIRGQTVAVGNDLRAESPLMFTRNFVATGGGTTLADIAAFDPDVEPFNDVIGVIITFGGAVKIVRKKDAESDMQAFFNPLDSDKSLICP